MISLCALPSLPPTFLARFHTVGWFCPPGTVNPYSLACGGADHYCPEGSGRRLPIARGYYAGDVTVDLVGGTGGHSSQVRQVLWDRFQNVVVVRGCILTRSGERRWGGVHRAVITAQEDGVRGEVYMYIHPSRRFRRCSKPWFSILRNMRRPRTCRARPPLCRHTQAPVWLR